MDTKRGQLTIFVILTMVLVGGLLTYYFLGDSLFPTSYEPVVLVVKDNFEGCLEEAYKFSLSNVGAQGGYAKVSEPYYTEYGYLFDTQVPYYYYEGDLFYPTLEDVTKSIETVASENLALCQELIGTNTTSADVIFTGDSVEVNIGDTFVSFTTKSSMIVSYNSSSSTIDFSEEDMVLDSNIKGMHTVAVFIANYYKQNNEWTSFTDITQKSQEQDVYTSMSDSIDGSESIIKILSVDETRYPLIYKFRNKFSHENLEEVGPLL